MEDNGREYPMIYNHVRDLKFETAPNYNHLTQCLAGLANRCKFTDDKPWDWEKGGVAYDQAKTAAVQPYASQMPCRNEVVKARQPGEYSDHDFIN